MPRHLRTTGEMPAVDHDPVGSSMADARRQLVLRTFASTGGDLERTAKLLGMSTRKCGASCSRVIGGTGGDGGRPHVEKRAAPAPAAKSKKDDPKAKKRR